MESNFNSTDHNPDQHVCPWRFISFLDNFIREKIHNPDRMFRPYLKPGMTALDIGCGGGFASRGMARLVGKTGKVLAADLQPQMLEVVKKKAKKSGLDSIIRTHLCQPDRIGIKGEFDFAVAFYMFHEVPSQNALLKELHSALNSNGRFYLIEPKGHVTKSKFSEFLARAEKIGFKLESSPKIKFSHAAVLKKVEAE